MTVLLSTDGDRISPVLDAAKSFLLVSATPAGAQSRKPVHIAEPDPIAKVKRIAGLGARVLICGAISWPLEAMLTSAGMRVIPNTCGPLDEVLAAHLSGALTAQAFLLPGLSRPAAQAPSPSWPRLAERMVTKSTTLGKGDESCQEETGQAQPDWVR